MKVLLRIPDLVTAVQPLVKKPIGADSIFELVGIGRVQPLGYLQRVPVFDITQIAEIADAIQENDENSLEAGKALPIETLQGKEV